MDRAVLRRAQALYAGATWRDRLHVAIRLALCPFAELAPFIPSAGRIVDLGCGHGVFAHALALEAPQRQVIGLDPSTHKLKVAQAAQPSPGSVRFVRGDVRFVRGDVHFVRGDAWTNPVNGPYQGVLLIDVLYLFTLQQQEQILHTCYDRLARGGILLLKTMDTRPRWKSTLNWLEEWLAVRVLRITLGEENAFTFRSLTEWAALCQAIGYKTQIAHLDRGYPHPHGAVIGVRTR